ncbi:hypothetical protein MRX96_015252 [Rhipicephalus microplus]
MVNNRRAEREDSSRTRLYRVESSPIRSTDRAASSPCTKRVRFRKRNWIEAQNAYPERCSFIVLFDEYNLRRAIAAQKARSHMGGGKRSRPEVQKKSRFAQSSTYRPKKKNFLVARCLNCLFISLDSNVRSAVAAAFMHNYLSVRGSRLGHGRRS